MKKRWMPLFPLNLVAFPWERLNLHIFEERYRQLIKECQDEGITFGIPAFIKNRIEYGTEVEIIAIDKRYEDGRLDIRCLGLNVFKVQEYQNPYPGKLYAAGQVEMLVDVNDQNLATKEELVGLVKQLYQALQMVKGVEVAEDILAFDVAHKVGLSKEQEYELLGIPSEQERQLYLIDHLQKAIPMLEEMERTKERIKMNGHFRRFDPLDF